MVQVANSEKLMCLPRVMAPDGTAPWSKTLELDAVEGWAVAHSWVT